ncbi:sperm motility kinase Z-like protein [Cricetulus griseus]|uniref:Sperm motility kinase Z-like protein n=1 Tax=Cricetulus griseus TaxID=10029 RepID=A0A061IHV6_CRIGR|nr:sperm motility kinase Z-like protein [Cricetulus griseus]
MLFLTRFCACHAYVYVRILLSENFNHNSKPCRKIITLLLMKPNRHRITICQLQERRCLGEIKEHVEPVSKEILPTVVETICNIGYTCEEIVSSLRHWQPNNKVTATFNILKHEFKCGNSHQQNGKPWLNSSPVGALHPVLPLNWASSEPAFPTFREAWKGDFQEDGVEGRGKRCQSCNMHIKYSCLDLMPCSDEVVPEGSVLKANVIHSATGDIAINMNSVDSLPGDFPSSESVLCGTPSRILNMDFSTEQPFLGPNMHNDQAKVGPTTSGCRPCRAWKLIRKLISHALRARCFVSEAIYVESSTLMTNL